MRLLCDQYSISPIAIQSCQRPLNWAITKTDAFVRRYIHENLCYRFV